jgi:hypothetical protein
MRAGLGSYEILPRLRIWGGGETLKEGSGLKRMLKSRCVLGVMTSAAKATLQSKIYSTGEDVPLTKRAFSVSSEGHAGGSLLFGSRELYGVGEDRDAPFVHEKAIDIGWNIEAVYLYGTRAKKENPSCDLQ